MSPSLPISQLQNSSIALERTLGMPEGGPKCIPLTLDFSVSLQYTFDYSNMQQRNYMQMVQTIWVDNSLSAQPLNVFSPGVNQTLKVPAGVQGYFTLICPNPIKLSFASTGGVLCQVILLNFPVLG